MASMLRYQKVLRLLPQIRQISVRSGFQHLQTGSERHRLTSQLIGVSRNFSVNQSHLSQGELEPRGVPSVGGTSRSRRQPWQSQPQDHVMRTMREFEDMVHSSGTVSKQKFMSVYKALCDAGSVTPNQAILLIRSCGSLLVSLLPEERNDLLVQVWDKLAELGIHYDVTHYNALLMAYLENAYKFSPMELLAQMESKGVDPNRITYQRLIKAYCRQGDVQGATLVLNVLKSKGLTVTESVFNSLIEGNAKAGDMESARKIVDSMRDLGIEPSLDTYMALAIAYAEKGDKDKIQEVMSEAEANGFSLTPNFYFKIIHGLTSSGHKEHVVEFVEKVDLRHATPDAVKLSLDLWSQGGYEESFSVLKSFNSMDNQWAKERSVQHFINNMIMSSSGPGNEVIIEYLDQIHWSGLHEEPYTHALQQSLQKDRESGLSELIMKKMQEKGIPVRTHYFYPLLAKKRQLPDKDARQEGVLSVMSTMLGMGVRTEPETYSDFVMFEFSDDLDEILQQISDTPMKEDKHFFTGYCQHILNRKLQAQTLHNIEQLYDLQPAVAESRRFRIFVSSYLNRSQTPNIQQFVHLLKKLTTNPPLEPTNVLAAAGDDDDFEVDEFLKQDPLGSYVYHSVNLINPQRFNEKWMYVKELFRELKKQNMSMKCNSVRGLRNVLKLRHVRKRALDDFVLDMVDEEELLADPTGYTDLLYGDMLTKVNVDKIEEKLKELKEQEGENDLKVKLYSKLLEVYALQNNPQRVDELLKEFKASGLRETIELKRDLLMAYCHLGNLEEAMKIKKDCDAAGTPITDPFVISSLMTQLVKTGKMEEAFELLREFHVTKGRGPEIRIALTNGMEELSEQGRGQEVRDIYKKCVAMEIFRPQDTPQKMAELILNAYINSNDLRGAITSMGEIHKEFQINPDTHRLLCMLVELGDKSLLQECLHSVTDIHGSMNMIHSLAFAFLECKKYDEAEKLLKATGLNVRMDRITWFMDQCLYNDNVEQLQNLLDLSADMNGMDKDTVYYYQLRLNAEKENNIDKCLQLYAQLEEDEFPLRARTLQYLATVLKSNGYEVPFTVPKEEERVMARRTRQPRRQEMDSKPQMEPEPKLEPEKPRQLETARQRVNYPADSSNLERVEYLLREQRNLYENQPNSFLRFLYGALGGCSRESVESFRAAKQLLLKELPELLDSDKFQLTEMHSRLNHNDIAGAHDLYRTLLADGKPLRKDIASKLGHVYHDAGDVDALVQMKTEYNEKVTGDEFPCNYLILGAYAKRNDVSGAVQYARDQKASGVPCTRLGLFHLFKETIDKDLPMEQVLELTEEYAKEGDLRPKRQLCQAYVFAGKRDVALQMLEASEGDDLKGCLLPVAIKVCQRRTPPLDADTIRWILDINNVEGTEKAPLYWYLVKAYHTNNDLEGARSVYEEMMNANHTIGNIELKRLAAVFKNHDQQVPFDEPPESISYYIDQISRQAKDNADTVVE